VKKVIKKDIGNAAGVIWKYLNQQSEPVALSAIRKNVKLSDTLLLMGLGWLAREDKLNIEMPKGSNSYKISLKG
jgi:hypothetical protein